MYINRLSLRRFAAFGEETVVPLSDITLLFGENGAGKSSVIKALLLLKQTLSPSNLGATLQLRGPLVDFGSYKNLFHQGNVAEDLSIGVSLWTGAEYEEHPETFGEIDTEFFHGQEFRFRYTGQSGSEEIRLAQVKQYLGEAFELLVPLLPDPKAGEISNIVQWPPRPRRPGVLLRIAKELINQENSAFMRRFAELVHAIPSMVDELERTRREPVHVDTLDGARSLNALTNSLQGYDDPSAALDALVDDLKGYSYSMYLADLMSLTADHVRTRLFLPSETAHTKFVAWYEVPWGAVPWGEPTPDGVPQPAFSRAQVLRALVSSDHAVFGNRPELLLSLAELVHGTADRVHELLEGLSHVGPVRPTPERFALPGMGVGAGVAERVAETLVSHPDLEEEVNSFLDHMNAGYHVHAERGPAGSLEDVIHLQVEDLRTQTRLGMKDIGSGIAQILPVIVAVLGNRDSIVTVQQPELHLHPRLQARLMDLFAFGGRAKGNQIIVETHSEYLVYRAQRLVRDKKLRPDQVSVVWMYRDEEGSHCYEMRMDEDGEFIDDWPGGFFDDGFDDIVAGA